MKTRLLHLIILSFLLLNPALMAQYLWTNFVGKPGGAGNVDGTGTAARFNIPRGIAMDGSGNVFVADTFNHTIRKITPAGVVTTFAGKSGVSGSADGTGADARFNKPHALAIGGGVLYVADYVNSTVRKITAAGEVTTLAGMAGENGFADGTGSAARFGGPGGITVAGDGMIYITDMNYHTIRKITPAGVVTTVAGTANQSGSADGTGSEARFDYPEGITVDGSGNLYVADSLNCTIRKITPAGVVTTLAGTVQAFAFADGTGAEAKFSYPCGLVLLNNGDLCVTDGNRVLRRVTPAGVVSTIAGMPQTQGVEDGTGSSARFRFPYAIARDASGNVYITDGENHNIRKMTADGAVTTLAGMAPFLDNVNGTGEEARFTTMHDIAAASSDEVFIAQGSPHLIRKATLAGVVSTHAGDGVGGYQDGPSASARFHGAYGTAADAAGNVYVGDTINHVIRKISSGEVTTLAGLAGVRGSVDGMGAQARLDYPRGMTAAADGTLYVSEYYTHKIRKISPDGNVTTLGGSFGYQDGTSSVAKFRFPADVAVNSAGDVYVADSENHVIRKITPAGVVSTLAGQPLVSGHADGAGAAARFNKPEGVAVDPDGNLIVTDTGNHVIRKITPGGVVTTIGGVPDFAAAQDGQGSAARFSAPARVEVTSSGVIYVLDRNNHRVVKGVPQPEIVVEEPAGTDLQDGVSVADFGAVTLTLTAQKTFTLRNDGVAKLTGLGLDVTGAHAADFAAADLAVSELAPGESTTFTVTFTANALGARAAVLHISSNDFDESSFDISLKAEGSNAPMVAQAPQPAIQFAGGSASFTAAAVHPLAPVAYQWLKNNSKITGATAATLTRSGLKLADAGSYSAVMTANGISVTRATTLTVVQQTTATLVSPTGGKLTLTVPFAGPATFEWTKDGAPITGAGNKLFLSSLNALNSWGLYECKVIAPGGGSVIGGSFTVRVFDSKPVVIQNQNMPDGAVGTPYLHPIQINTENRFSPAAYAAKKLPPGVKLDTKTGVISGVPTVAGDYEIIVSASNGKGSHSSIKETITITPLPAAARGVFTASVARRPMNEELGGRVDFTVASTAAISGSITMGVKKFSFKGQLVTGGAQPVADITIPRPGLPALELHLDFDLAKNQIADTSSVKADMQSALVHGWRHIWKNKGAAPLNPATATPKMFTFCLRPTAIAASQPAGDGYGSFTLAGDGMVKITGKTGDGENFTCSTFAGPQGQILLFQTLHTPKGSLLGTLDIDPADSGALNADLLEGAATWMRPANAKSRVYAAGFGPMDLAAFGARHTPPAAPALILGMTLGDKAMITFAEGGLGTASINPDVTSFDILAGNKPDLPPALSLENPGSVKITKLDAKTGIFTGTFLLNDPEVRAAFMGKSLPRTAKFSGILTHDAMGPVGVGHFLLAEMPRDAAAPLPATTPATSAILSGSVLLEKK